MVGMFKKILVTMIMMTMTGTMTWITIEVGLILPPTNGAIWWEGSFHSTHWWSYEQSNWRQNKKSQKWYQIGMLYFVLPRFFQYFCIDIIRQDYPIFLEPNSTLGKYFKKEHFICFLIDLELWRIKWTFSWCIPNWNINIGHMCLPFYDKFCLFVASLKPNHRKYRLQIIVSAVLWLLLNKMAEMHQYL